jgi:hypothetical protein
LRPNGAGPESVHSKRNSDCAKTGATLLPAIDPSPQGLPHRLEGVIEVHLELAGHEDVVEEDEDAIHVMGKFLD